MRQMQPQFFTVYEKIQNILNDRSKFIEIQKDSTENLKKKANKLISTLYATENLANLSKIIGDLKPGYIYGNIKIHKNGNPLRPIISQITTPTYKLAKTLNKIIQSYIPNKYMLTSTNDFLDIIQ